MGDYRILLCRVACPSCAFIAEVFWNGIGEPECETCGRPYLLVPVREATAEEVAGLGDGDGC